LTQEFFSIDYFKNHHFVRLMRNWNIYEQSDESDDLILAEWEETLLYDSFSFIYLFVFSITYSLV